MTEFGDFSIKFTVFRYFRKSGPAKFLVLDPLGLLERFTSIPAGRTSFNKILAFKIENFGV